MRTFDLDEAAAFLHMNPQEVRTRANRGIIPGAKRGRRWVSSTEPFFRGSVGLSRSHTIRRDELWIVSRTEGQTEARGPTENEGPRGHTPAGDPVRRSP
jgi:hypothetical protein